MSRVDWSTLGAQLETRGPWVILHDPGALPRGREKGGRGGGKGGGKNGYPFTTFLPIFPNSLQAFFGRFLSCSQLFLVVPIEFLMVLILLLLIFRSSTVARRRT